MNSCFFECAGAYAVEYRHAPAHNGPSSVFQSTLMRDFMCPVDPAKQTPGPGYYKVAVPTFRRDLLPTERVQSFGQHLTFPTL